MTNTTNVKFNGNNVLLVSDNLNYLCLKAKDILDNKGADSLEVVYDSVVNRDNKGAIIDYDSTENTITKMRDLFGTSNYNSIWIKGFSALSDDSYMEKPKSKRGRKPKNTIIENKAEDTTNNNSDNQNKDSKTDGQKSKRGRKPKNANAMNTPVDKSNEQKEDSKNPTGRRGAPSLSQEVLDFRFDIISDYDENKITTEEAINKLGVTEGVFRNLVSEFHRCKKSNRRKAFGKSGIIKRTYKLYGENKISSTEAAENIGVSVATFLNWYKTDNGIEELERGRKPVKSK